MINEQGAEIRAIELDVAGYNFSILPAEFVIGEKATFEKRLANEEGDEEGWIRAWKERYTFIGRLISGPRRGTPASYDIVHVGAPVGVRQREGLMGQIVYLFEVDAIFFVILILGALFATFVILGKEYHTTSHPQQATSDGLRWRTTRRKEV